MLSNSFKAKIKKNLWMLQNSLSHKDFTKKICVATAVSPKHLLFAIWESLGTYKLGTINQPRFCWIFIHWNKSNDQSCIFTFGHSLRPNSEAEAEYWKLFKLLSISCFCSFNLTFSDNFFNHQEGFYNFENFENISF